jgi:hypothetical protein
MSLQISRQGCSIRTGLLGAVSGKLNSAQPTAIAILYMSLVQIELA